VAAVGQFTELLGAGVGGVELAALRSSDDLVVLRDDDGDGAVVGGESGEVIEIVAQEEADREEGELCLGHLGEAGEGDDEGEAGDAIGHLPGEGAGWAAADALAEQVDGARVFREQFIDGGAAGGDEGIFRRRTGAGTVAGVFQQEDLPVAAGEGVHVEIAIERLTGVAMKDDQPAGGCGAALPPADALAGGVPPGLEVDAGGDFQEFGLGIRGGHVEQAALEDRHENHDDGVGQRERAEGAKGPAFHARAAFPRKASSASGKICARGKSVSCQASRVSPASAHFSTMSQDSNRLPPQTKYIVGNEACERLSYYGVLAILTNYLVKQLHFAPQDADQIVHYWKCFVYLMPLLGAWVADRFWGRYNTILWVSLAYCGGHAILAFSENSRVGLFIALGLLGIGAGGIKPCVSAFVGDQFVGGKERLLTKVYALFYWSINFGSFFAFHFIPQIKDKYGYSKAFAIPGIAMGLATLLFWLGSRTYVKRPPSHLEDQRHPPTPAERADDKLAVRGIIMLFAPIVVFWTLFDQTDTSWIHQGDLMKPWDLGFWKISAESMREANPILVMALIPLTQFVIYPLCERMGLRPTPLRRMGTGMVLAAISFAMASVLETRATEAASAGAPLSLGWQFPQFLVLTAGEVLVSTTGLEFAFSQAPKRLKSTILSLWFLSVALGNLLTAQVKKVNDVWLKFPLSGELFFYSVLMLVVAGIFAVIAKSFHERPVVADPADTAVPADPGRAA
jgi:POT family proton-dependent oligopeptide transporter